MKFPRKIGRWIIGLLVLSLLFLLFRGPDSIAVLARSHKENHDMEKTVKILNQTIDSLEVLIERMKHDTIYIGRIAREKLGMAHKNETIYKFIDTRKNK